MRRYVVNLPPATEITPPSVSNSLYSRGTSAVFRPGDVDQRPNAGVAADQISQLYLRFRKRPVQGFQDIVHIREPRPDLIRSFPVVGIGRPDDDSLVPRYDEEKATILDRWNQNNVVEIQPAAWQDDMHALGGTDPFLVSGFPQEGQGLVGPGSSCDHHLARPDFPRFTAEHIANPRAGCFALLPDRPLHCHIVMHGAPRACASSATDSTSLASSVTQS